jgi:predicted SnoaL-like aldol condensation-catalyzing enzyme
MKKVFFTAFAGLACFLISCTNTATKPAAGTSISSQAEKNAANSMAVYKGIEKGDLSAMDSFVATDCVDHTGSMKGEVSGRDNIKKNLADIHNHIANLKFDIIAEGTSTDGDYHFALTRMTGTCTDTMMGRPANTPLNETSIDVVKLVDGKAKEHWEFVDPKEMMKMMAKMPTGKK